MSDELKDQLRKLGLRIRPRSSEKATQPKPGTNDLDPRGNAVHQWSTDTLAEDGETDERARHKAPEFHGLTIIDDEPPKNAPIRQNPKGLRVGYNPYESGMLAKKAAKKRTDLRQLSKHLEMKRKMEKKK